MKKLTDQLKAIAKSLATLSTQVERVTKQIDKLKPTKTAVVKKKKPTSIKQIEMISPISIISLLSSQDISPEPGNR